MERRESDIEAEAALLKIFEKHQAELYWLAFLLTGDREQSVQVFTRALDLKDGANPVFRNFMLSWARKLVIAEALAAIDSELHESALRMQTPNLTTLHSLPTPDWIDRQSITRAEFENAVLALDVLPRCAVLLLTFERLSLEESTLLLNADRDLVKTAQRRGLIELVRNIALGRGWAPAVTHNELKGFGVCRKKWTESVSVNG